ncbi:MAG: ribosome-binding factor A [Omnitrophica WOR_2 bacterium RIFCSPLOWO2_02_FULL_63_16]|nr:MAG: ribosome-binding factor A [Omnitrophica WOR_2 bacterium GWA2_63_20]OGX17257.1 MAG: ribosome-binding factor A [Omnitrophica WOR_2 bacterium GWF2_63_9]OGX31310.1 MAG: ribosome-binding factor A [Omnitrophica WOR_2 bacterium RIFCSPHIGHO2_12_FULL_64_13]OGX36957.1 MAG: ribosome-binding factor A [Omnitrophica WOR_2 bacterium RIFCSPHIGHO2_02_FULL_63_39]OGX46436.1 MAG: ribosome-binding factor A [Omnitrophica WOR_2 bacterium RIFCSPLOWO2_02_FULL_63_16]OGX49811.1 MAG: ribosome-binding factor A [Om
MLGTRKERLNQQLQREIAVILQRELKDPEIGFVTITRVELSNDLAYAKVGYSCLGGPDERHRSQQALDRSSGYVRNLVRKRLHLKIIPQLLFRFDESIEGSIDMAKQLDQLNQT